MFISPPLHAHPTTYELQIAPMGKHEPVALHASLSGKPQISPDGQSAVVPHCGGVASAGGLASADELASAHIPVCWRGLRE
jgi:hypothetical protein